MRSAPRPFSARPLLTAALAIVALVACSSDDESTDTTVAGTGGATTETAGTDTATTDTAGATTDGSTDTTDQADDADRSEDAFVAAGAEALNLGDEEQSRCVAQAIIDAIGYDQLEASGLTPEEFNASPSLTAAGLTVDDAVGPQLQSDVIACGDLLEAFATSTGLTPEQADCAQEFLTNELLAESIVVTVLESEPSAEYAAAVTSAQECAGS